MTNIFLAMLFAISCIGLPITGVVATHLFWYFRNTFPWQLRIQMLEEEVKQKSEALETREDELSQIRNRLLDALDKEQK